EQILWGLAHADVVKISDEEVEFLWGITDEKEAAEKLLDEFGIRLAMVTMGPKGAYLANQNGAAYAKCPKVKPIDTTGAGDIFGGSAVSRLLKTGKVPEELSTEELGFIGQFACTAASISTTQSGGIPSIPEEETVLARM
ncbi:MAG: carbohydrate kinase family protein, partial [Pilosibacter sp.]